MSQHNESRGLMDMRNSEDEERWIAQENAHDTSADSSNTNNNIIIKIDSSVDNLMGCAVALHDEIDRLRFEKLAENDPKFRALRSKAPVNKPAVSTFDAVLSEAVADKNQSGISRSLDDAIASIIDERKPAYVRTGKITAPKAMKFSQTESAAQDMITLAWRENAKNILSDLRQINLDGDDARTKVDALTFQNHKLIMDKMRTYLQKCLDDPDDPYCDNVRESGLITAHSLCSRSAQYEKYDVIRVAIDQLTSVCKVIRYRQNAPRPHEKVSIEITEGVPEEMWIHIIQYMDTRTSFGMRLVWKYFDKLFSVDNIHKIYGTNVIRIGANCNPIPILSRYYGKIKNVDISGNMCIKTWEADVMNRIYMLDISHIDAPTIRSYAFASLHNVEIMDISYSTFQLDIYAFKYLKNMQYLICCGHRLKPIYFKQMPTLKCIVVDYGSIVENKRVMPNFPHEPNDSAVEYYVNEIKKLCPNLVVIVAQFRDVEDHRTLYRVTNVKKVHNTIQYNNKK